MATVALGFLVASLFCGILLPGEGLSVTSTALLVSSMIALCLWLAAGNRIRLGIVNGLQGLMLVELLLPLTTTTLLHFWGNYLSFAYAAVSFLCWSNLVRRQHRRWIVGVLAIYAFVLVGQIAWRALELAQQGVFSGVYKLLMVVPFGASNYLGGPLLILFFVFLCIKGQEVPNRLGWVVLAALLVGMLLIHSRATLAALACTLLLYLQVRRRPGGTKMRIVVGSGLAFVLGTVVLIGALTLTGQYGSFTAGLDFFTGGRIELLKGAAVAFLRHPWFGSGLGNSPTFSIPGYTIELWHAHNFVMDLLMFSGGVGMAIQCSVYWVAAQRMRAKIASSPWAMGAFFSLIAILVDALAEPSVFTYKVDALLWMVLGIGYAAYCSQDTPSIVQLMRKE